MAAQVRTMNKLRRMMFKFRNATLASAINSWVHITINARVMRGKLAKAAGRLYHKHLAGAWETWCANVMESRDKQVRPGRGRLAWYLQAAN